MDRNELEQWLEARPREDAILIAQRAALRMFPFWAQDMSRPQAQARKLSCLMLLRPLLVMGAAKVEVKSRMSHAAFIAISALEYVDPKRAVLSNSHQALAMTKMAIRTADYFAARPPPYYASRMLPFFGSRFEKLIGDEVLEDVSILSRGMDIWRLPLWTHDRPSDWLIADFNGSQNLTVETGRPNSFWHRWWDGAKRGEWLDRDLQREVALIANDIWQAGPAAVMAEIDRIEARFALILSNNGEEVEPNPQTGKLRLVASSALPAELGIYVRRKISKAVDLFNGSSGQVYGALLPDLEMLRAAVRDAENLPVELYDVCASANRRLVRRMERGECAAADKDPLIEDYQIRLLDAVADIITHDPMTQEVLERRNKVRGNDALVMEASIVEQATQIILPTTEGRLKDMLSVDGSVATNPDANSEDRKTASFRWSGRMMRAIKWTGIAVIGGGLAQLGVRLADAGINETSAEVLKQAWVVILRYLGLG